MHELGTRVRVNHNYPIEEAHGVTGCIDYVRDDAVVPYPYGVAFDQAVQGSSSALFRENELDLI